MDTSAEYMSRGAEFFLSFNYNFVKDLLCLIALCNTLHEQIKGIHIG